MVRTLNNIIIDIYNMTDRPYYGFPIFFIIISVFKIIPFILFIFICIFLNFPWYILFFIVLINLLIIYKLIIKGKEFKNFQLSQVNKIVNLLNLTDNEVILDLGTGSGILAITQAKYTPNGKVFAIDQWNWPIKFLITSPLLLSSLMMGCTKKDAKKNARIEKVIDRCIFINGDFTNKLNFTNNYFDIISSMQSLYFIKSEVKQKILFKEIDRILKIGGKIILHEPNRTITNYNWNLDNVINFYKNIGYKMKIYPVEKERHWKINSSILIGIKIK